MFFAGDQQVRQGSFPFCVQSFVNVGYNHTENIGKSPKKNNFKSQFNNWDNSSKAKLDGFALGEIIRRDSEQSMSEMLGDKSVNALGTIAKLNHYFGWREDGNRTQNINISVSESPKVIADRYKAALTDSQLSDNNGQNAD